MAYSNIDQATIIPSISPQIDAWSDRLYARGERTRLLKEQQAKADQQRSDGLVKYIGEQFKDKNFMTGTAQDPYINEKLAKYRADLSAQVQANPNMSYSDLTQMTNKYLSELNADSSSIKAVMANINDRAKMLAHEKGIDPEAWKQLAASEFLYKTDPATGKRRLKTLEERDPTVDYMEKAYNDHPDLIVKGHEGIREYVKGFQLSDRSMQAHTYDSKGRQITKEYKLKLPSYAEPELDKNGWATGVKVRSVKEDGIDVVDPITYQDGMANTGTAGAVKVEFKKFNDDRTEAGKKPIPEDSHEGEIIKRQIMLQLLDRYKTTEFAPGYKSMEDLWKGQQGAGYVPWSVIMAQQRQSSAGDKKTAALEATDQAITFRGMFGDGNVTQGLQAEDIKGNDMYDITGRLGGLKLGYDEDHQVQFAKGVYVDPKNHTMAIKDAKGDIKIYKADEARALWAKVAPYNGVALDKSNAVSDMYLDPNHKYKGPDYGEDNLARENQEDIVNNNADMTFQKKLAAFEDNDNAKTSQFLEGTRLKDGRKILEVHSRNVAQRLVMPDYKILIQDDRGDKPVAEPMEFRTKVEFKKWLLENRKPKYDKSKK